MTVGSFSGFIKTVQQNTAHLVSFTIKNSLPADNGDFESKILIMMPEKMQMTAAERSAVTS